MAQFTLGGEQHPVPASKSDFQALIEKLTAAHPGVREQVMLFSMRAVGVEGIAPVASMVGEGKYGTLHLLFEILGRPDVSGSGYVERNLSVAGVESLHSAFTPFLGDGQSHPNIAFLQAAREAEAAVQVTLLAPAGADAKNRPDYIRARTNLLFDLFNEGALRGSDGAARQALLDSFSFLPNEELSAGGAFLQNAKSDKSFFRAGVGTAAESESLGGIDKFPSLMAVRGERLKRDGNRIIPSAMIRDGVHVGKRNIFMFHAAVNIAAFIGDDNMVDSHASIASAAQIGNKNKIGSFVSVEGVLSPANAVPVYIGDENFIGTFARIGTGIIVGNKNFIGAGVNISKGTKLKDCRDGSSSKGDYVNVQDLNGAFNGLAIAPNNAVREFNGVKLVPGEYILFENGEEFMRRFEGDERIKAGK